MSYLPKHIGRKRKVAKKIKVTLKHTGYYDVVVDKLSLSKLGPNATSNQHAQLDKELFVDHQISWDDLFDRSDVEFEGVSDEED